jgi:hypothetical protein
MVMGDFNDTPKSDHNFVKRKKKYPKNFSLLKYLSTRSLDAFRAMHPQVHGHTFKQPGGLPSRLDSIYCPPKWLPSLLSPEAQASVDYTCANFTSGYLPVFVSVSFHTVFGVSSRAVRVKSRRSVVSKIDLRPLSNP